MSNVLKDAVDAINTHEKFRTMSGSAPSWPEGYENCAKQLHMIDLDITNAIQHKMISYVWNILMYKTWIYHRKTYILDTEFFMSLTKAKSIRIYPSVLKTLPFKTFSVDLSGMQIFNGYIICSLDITDQGIYYSFLAKEYDTDKDSKSFGVFLDVNDMEKDEKGEPYFELDKHTELESDIAFFRKMNRTDSLKDIFLNKIIPLRIKTTTHFLNVSHNTAKRMEEADDEYFTRISSINDEERWFLLKKALIQFAYYLCTPEPDIYESSETRKSVKRAEKLKKKFEDIEYKYTVGSRIGARIRLGKEASNDTGETVEYRKGTVMCPHVRAAHWTHVWCGPKGNQHIEPRFIEVCFVNYNLGEIDEICNEVSNRVRKNWEGENYICRTLDSLKIGYRRQSPIVVDNHRYRFDVKCKVKGKTCYIEYDGEQHFFPVKIFGGTEGFNRTREADEIKNRYCYENDIYLLRIPYKDKNKIDSIVRRFIENPKENSFTENNEIKYYAV